MRVSLRALFGILFFLLMIGTILISCLINTFFLEKYYVSDRRGALIRVYDGLMAASVRDLLETDEFDIALRQALRESNTSLLVMDSNTRAVKVWSADQSVMEERLYSNIFGFTPIMEGGYADDGEDGAPVLEKVQEAEDSGGVDEEEDEEDSGGGTYSSDYVIVRILEQEKPYTVNLVLDRRTGTRSMEMWGPLGENSFFLLRSPLEDIRSSATAANRFFAYTGIALAVSGAFLAWWLSRLLTRPVRQLADISVRMKDLDFSAKYEPGHIEELDFLGRNMNELSQTLETTISALRTANNDLQRDLDRKGREEEMRRDFLSNVTHELKTPIALIRGYAEGLQDGIADDPESREEYLGTILEESERMNTIVQKVLQLNQLEFGDGSVSMERFDLAGMIRNYLDSASLLARQEGIALHFHQDGPVYAWGDPFLIQDVIQNYYSNALHHVGPPGRAIDIRCERIRRTEPSGKAEPPGRTENSGRSDFSGHTEPSGRGGISGRTGDGRTDAPHIRNGSTVRVTIFNTGKPIPAEAIPHLWEKFYKVDKARTRAYGGSGVGLSIVKAIMDLHHREYGVENYENGVAFWFELDGSGPAEAGSPETKG